MVIGSERRAQRRNRRSIDDLDAESRTRLRRLVTGSRLVAMPTSEVIGLVESRFAPGTVSLAVTCTHGLGLDQTIAVSEVLAARGYDVTPHLAAWQTRTPRHLDEILRRLARRAIDRVFVIRGRAGQPGSFPTSRHLLEAIRQHPDAPAEIGIAGYPEGFDDVDRERLAGRLLDRTAHATYVSTAVSLSPERVLRWVAEMRVRGLELPIEVGIPGVVRMGEIRQQAAGTPYSRKRASEWYDPTLFVAQLAGLAVVDRLDLAGLRIDTSNQIDATAAWRQEIYDLANQARTG